MNHRSETKTGLDLMFFRALSLVGLWAVVAPLARAQDVAAPALHLRPLPLAQWLRDDDITVVTSPHDIGALSDIFDGNSNTLLRSQQINPQQTVRRGGFHSRRAGCDFASRRALENRGAGGALPRRRADSLQA